jgi:hypothetical protein
MSENLFYPLFLISVYLIFRAEKENKKWFYGVSGVVIGLAVLSRIIGLVLIVAFVLYLFYKLIFYKEYDIRQSYTIISFLLVVLPVYLLKGISHEFSEQGTLGFISSPFEHAKHNILDTILITNSHFIYLILGCGVILGLLCLVELYEILKNKEKTSFSNFIVFSWIVAFCTIIVSGIFLSGEYSVVSRYIAFLIPLFFIAGFKSVDRWNNKRKIFIIAAAIVFFLSFFFVHNNEIEILRCYTSYYSPSFENILLFEFLTLLVFVPVLFFFKININRRRDLIRYMLISFLCSLLVLGVINDFNIRSLSLSSQKSFNNEHIGKYLATQNGSVVYDEDTYKDFKTYFWGLKFWCNREVHIGDMSSSNMFFVSSKNLPLPVIRQQELYYSNGTVLYLYLTIQEDPPLKGRCSSQVSGTER